MNIKAFINTLGSDFFTGVPDSQLKELCNYLMGCYGIDAKHHVIAANEGNCVALAAGYHLATGKVPVVYMQNSGEGNIINPVASLLNDHVYAIPMIFVIGWRGEPGVHDEPQHVFQGMVTEKLLCDMDIAYYIVDESTTDEELEDVMQKFQEQLKQGKQVAFIIRKGALSGAPKVEYVNAHTMVREEIIKHIAKVADEDPVISTTGKASRELFEFREAEAQSHKYDFLTVGSMGHASSIALGVAVQKPNSKIWCVDGDGAALMHLGAMAVIANTNPSNMVHVVINNGAHETVGGMPTVVGDICIADVAKMLGYTYVVTVDTFEDLDRELCKVKVANMLTLIEVKSSIGARSNLGRPTTTAIENKKSFMAYLQELN